MGLGCMAIVTMQNGPWMAKVRMQNGPWMAMVRMQNGHWMHGYGHDAEWALDARLWSQ